MTDRDDALKELGRMLTERRESAGLTLEAVFDRTKIRPEYLKGIEAGEYTKDFPELVYIKGFVRTYLKLVGAEDMQEEFMMQLDRANGIAPSRKQDANPRTKGMSNILGNGSTMPKGFKPASHFWLFLVLVAALLGTAAYVWYAVSYGGLDIRNLKLFSFSGAGGPLSLQGGLSGDIDISLEGDIEPVSLDESGDEEPEEEEQTPSLEIHAVNDVWLSVAFGNAAPTYRRTLRRGDFVKWELSAPARVVIGRPTAAQVILNGKDLGIVNPSAKKSETYIYNPDGTFRRANTR